LNNHSQNSIDGRKYFVHECIILAFIAKECGDYPVGCVVVKDDEIIDKGIKRGRTNCDITFHVEIEAMPCTATVSMMLIETIC